MNKKNNNLGEMIAQLRKNANLKQGELAKLLKISHSSMSQYESGARIPNDKLKIKIADFFNVSVDFLIGHNPRKTENSIVFKTLPKHQQALLEICKKLNKNDFNKVLEYATLLSVKTT